MSKVELDLLCEAARSRLQAGINRSAAQQIRRFKTFCARQDAALSAAAAKSGNK